MTDQNGNDRSKGEDRSSCKGREHVHGTCMREDSARGSWPSDQLSLQLGAWKSGVFCLCIIFCIENIDRKCKSGGFCLSIVFCGPPLCTSNMAT
jgi:hypothetical protein